GKRATDDESEKTRTSHSHRSRRTDLIEQPQRFSRIGLAIGQWFIERLELFDGGGCGSYRAFTNSFQIADRARRSVGKKFFVHDCASYRTLLRHSLREEENKRPKIGHRIVGRAHRLPDSGSATGAVALFSA